MTEQGTLPLNTATFLFTDIEGSTRLWEDHPRAMQAALSRHDAILREAIETNGGQVFKTVGDAFYAIFASVSGAILAALSAQRALQAVSWETARPIKVRMALHAGPAEQRDNDYFGLTLNRVARLLSAGHGGQILLSAAAEQLAHTHLPRGTELRDLGVGGLKDLARPEYIYQLVARDLPSEFPPLKTINLRPSGTGVAALAAEEGTEDSSVEVANPYKGLRAFHEGDAADFFGREELIVRLLARLDESALLHRFLAVVGPSGSGKSSVVHAGLIPALRRGLLPGAQRWLIAEMIPGTHPIEELAALLVTLAGSQSNQPSIQLLNERDGLLRFVERILPVDDTVELVLVIDQFEEVFTLVEDEGVRVHFLNSLYTAVVHPESRIRIIITLRADFYDRPLLYPNPAALVQQRAEVVVPLSANELEQAIVQPAHRAGVKLEPELVAVISQDVGEQPGTLPLMEYALTELYDRRQDNVMTLAAYRASGGVHGALARRADTLFTELDPADHEEARQLFLRLVTLGEGVEDTRRRVRMSELNSACRDSSALKRVIDSYGAYRLLTFDRDPVTHEPTVEVAHEALIRAWSRMREWLEASREQLRVHRQLIGATAEWLASGRDSSFLATGVRLAQFAVLADAEGGTEAVALTMDERAYVQTSIEERDKGLVIEKARQAKELVLQKRAASRLRNLVAGLAIFLAIAIGLSLFAFDRQADADTQRREAQTNLVQAQTRRWAAEASVLMQSQTGNPEIALLLSIRSLQTLYSPEGDAGLMMAARQPVLQQVFAGHTARLNSVAISPDGKWLVTGSSDNTARLWDVGTGQEIRRIDRNVVGGFVSSVAFSSDGKELLVGSQSLQLIDAVSGIVIHDFSIGGVVSAALSHDGSYMIAGLDTGLLYKWDTRTGKELMHFNAHSSDTYVSLSADDKYIISTSKDHMAALWDAATGKRLQVFIGHAGPVWSAAISPDAKELVTGGGDSSVRLWNTQTGEQLRRFDLAGVASANAVAFTPNGKWIVVGDSTGEARLWDAQTGKEIGRFVGHTGPVFGIAVSPDGRYLATASDDETARLWQIQPQAVRAEFVGHTQAVGSVRLSPDGRYLLTGSADKTARLWDAASGKELHVLQGYTDFVVALAFSPDSRYVVTSSGDGTMSLWDVTSGERVNRFPTPNLGAGQDYIDTGVFSPDGKYLLTGDTEGRVYIWDLQKGYAVRNFGPGHNTDAVYDVDFSPDGKYVLSSGWDNIAYMWEVDTGKLIETFAGHTGAIQGVAFSPDGNYVVTTSDDKTARLWNAWTGMEVRRFTGHTSGLKSLPKFSADGKYIYTRSLDDTLRQWDTQTGAEIRRVSFTALGDFGAFLPGGQYLDIISGPIVEIWDANWKDTVRLACRSLRRDFTNEERAQYGIKDKEPICPK